MENCKTAKRPRPILNLAVAAATNSPLSPILHKLNLSANNKKKYVKKT